MSEDAVETSPPSLSPLPQPAMSAFGQIALPNQAVNSGASPTTAAQQLAEYQHRMQLYEFAAQAAVRFRLNQLGAVSGTTMVHPALEAASSFGFDPRFRFMHEEPKPQHSYIGLIAMAILSSPEKKMVLSDIYQHILDHYPYFRNRGPGWRNSIRHNLSLNDCFVKAGRSANGKGHYWAIHPANIDDFTKGDFRRRKAQRKVRKHMGLSVPDDEDSSSPTPTPTPALNPNLPPFIPSNPHLLQGHHFGLSSFRPQLHFPFDQNTVRHPSQLLASLGNHFTNERSGRRLFDVESLLAPDSTVNDDGKRNEAKRVDTSSPARSTESPIGLVRAESNCSSPSISSTEVTTPPPTSVADTISSIPGLSTWQLHLQQLNATFFNHSRNGAGLSVGHPLHNNNLNPHHFPPHFSPAVSWAAAAAAFPQSAVNLYTSLASSASSSSSASSASSAASGHHNHNNHSSNHHHNLSHHPIHHHHLLPK